MTVMFQSLIRCRQGLALQRSVGVGRNTSLFSSSSSSVELLVNPDNFRSKFKDTPVDPSAFKYIESIGVGIPKRKHTKRRGVRLRGRRATNTNTNANTNTNTKTNFLTHQEEQEELRPIRRFPSKIPPPPFAAPYATTTTTKKNKDSSTPIIQRLPVKLIGSVASKEEGGGGEEAFPRGSKGLAEVAIAGRSNVGKSTLLNALLYGNMFKEQDTEEEERLPFRKRPRPTARTARLPKGLKAITSSKPGETRTLNFYQISSLVKTEDKKKKVSLLLVDLPGYGFAYATQNKMEGWKSLMQDYILNRGKPLKRILFLLDARHGMKKADLEFMESLQTALYDKQHDGKSSKKRELPSIQLVLTKCDLVHQTDLARRVGQVRQQLSDCLIRQPSALPVMLVSAQMEGQAGVLELQKELASLVPTITTSATASNGGGFNRKHY